MEVQSSMWAKHAKHTWKLSPLQAVKFVGRKGTQQGVFLGLQLKFFLVLCCSHRLRQQSLEASDDGGGKVSPT